MNEIGTYVDGHKLLTESLFRSGSFVTACAVCLGAILFTAYIIVRHFQTLSLNAVVLLGGFIGVHLFYQWWRAARYLQKMRQLYAEAEFEYPRDGSSLDIGLRVAARSIPDLLFYHFGMVIVCLALIELLLFRIDGLK